VLQGLQPTLDLAAQAREEHPLTHLRRSGRRIVSLVKIGGDRIVHDLQPCCDVALESVHGIGRRRFCERFVLFHLAR